MMTWVAFYFLITGVLLNAGAQLLLKAGTNVLGVITLTADNWPSQFGRMALEPHIAAGLACYVVSVVVWIIACLAPVSIAIHALLATSSITPAHYLLANPDAVALGS